MLGVVGKFRKELRDHELVHWGAFWHIHPFSKCFLSTYHVKKPCVGHVYAGFIVFYCCYCDVLELTFKKDPCQIIVCPQFTKWMGKD